MLNSRYRMVVVHVPPKLCHPSTLPHSLVATCTRHTDVCESSSSHSCKPALAAPRLLLSQQQSEQVNTLTTAPPLPPSSSSFCPGTPTLCHPAPCSPCSRWARSACLARRECRATAAAGTAVATTSRRPACNPSYHWCRCRWWRWCRRWCCCRCCCCCRQPDRGSR